VIEFGQLKIYLVDDDPSIRKGLTRLLQSFGLTVDTFGSAEEFLEASVQESNSCLILDINLGQMSGFGLQEHLSNNGSSIPVIFITAYDDEHTHRKMLKTGVPFLIKPFADQNLLRVLHTVAARMDHTL
jgi:FixJ family two-component response regulator